MKFLAALASSVANTGPVAENIQYTLQYTLQHTLQ